MNNFPKISIIIPIYNAEKYLRDCIDSVLSQSFSDFELLLIDDGSKDKSGEICDEYSSRDSRIRVFHKENGGVSSARNIGLDNANGEWVAFVDADDEVTNGYFDIRKEHQYADVIVKPHYLIKSEGDTVYYSQEVRVLRDRDSIYRYYVQKRNNALWDKLIKRNLIGHTRFHAAVSIGEDFLFSLSVLPKVKVWAFDNVGAYRYFVREGSAMQSVELEERIRILWENVVYVQEFNGSSDFKAVQKGIVYKSYIMLLYNYRQLLKKDELNKLKKMVCNMRLKDLKYVDITTKGKLFLIKINILTKHAFNENFKLI